MKPAEGSYQDLTATSLFCNRCGGAVPVRQRLLLVLPDGELHEYRCEYCWQTLGTKKVTHGGSSGGIVVP